MVRHALRARSKGAGLVANEPFDLERLRRRWALAASTATRARAPAVPEGASPTKPGGAAPAAAHAVPLAKGVPDAKGAPLRSLTVFAPFERAHGDLAELRCALAAGLGREGCVAVEPFLNRVEQAVARIENAYVAAPPADPKALRVELESALFDLEDLLEALTVVAT